MGGQGPEVVRWDGKVRRRQVEEAREKKEQGEKQ